MLFSFKCVLYSCTQRTGVDKIVIRYYSYCILIIKKSSHSCCKSSIISGCSEPGGSSVALGFAFLPCSTIEARWRSRCPSSGGVAVSLLTMFYCDCFIVQSVGDQTGVTQLGFFVSARHCKAAVLAQERVRNLWQILGKQIH
ncbi:Hypothetical_protein [Hexamita inflata]|uniref:Hypothetical_protein n=1 Tax=Hexamita inflata TaxID=28002 RepID=A0AA86RIK9_9EUKA|nr:Hypothetical protein HINF_LOCUS63103 [Hexamita inflata]